jgi:hypothetical protein
VTDHRAPARTTGNIIVFDENKKKEKKQKEQKENKMEEEEA